eukprot:320013-Pyramimonas_sp.AAC.1
MSSFFAALFWYICACATYRGQSFPFKGINCSRKIVSARLPYDRGEGRPSTDGSGFCLGDRAQNDFLHRKIWPEVEFYQESDTRRAIPNNVLSQTKPHGFRHPLALLADRTICTSVTERFQNIRCSDHIPVPTVIERYARNAGAHVFIPLWLARHSVYQEMSTQSMTDMLMD